MDPMGHILRRWPDVFSPIFGDKVTLAQFSGGRLLC